MGASLNPQKSSQPNPKLQIGPTWPNYFANMLSGEEAFNEDRQVVQRRGNWRKRDSYPMSCCGVLPPKWPLACVSDLLLWCFMSPDRFGRWLETLHKEMHSAPTGQSILYVRTYATIFAVLLWFCWIFCVDILYDFSFRLLSSAVAFHVGPLSCAAAWRIFGWLLWGSGCTKQQQKQP